MYVHFLLEVCNSSYSQQLYSLSWLTKQCIFMHLLHSGVVKVGMDSAVNPGYVFHYINSLRIFYHGVIYYLFHNFFGCIFNCFALPELFPKDFSEGHDCLMLVQPTG